jgi:hypothetical protein
LQAFTVIGVRELSLADGGDEPVAPTSDGLDKPGPLWVILQHLPNFANCGVDAVISIEKNILAPDSFDYLVAAYKLSSLFDQEKKQLHGDALQLEDAAGAAQFVDPQVQLKIFAQADLVGRLDWVGSHGPCLK